MSVAKLIVLPGLDGSAVLAGPLCRALQGALATEVVEYGADDVDYAALLPRLRARCAAAGPHVVLGWSFSGPLAIALAADPPPGLRGVILAATFARSPWPCGGLLSWFARPRLMTLGLTGLAPLASLALGSGRGERGAALRRDKQLAWGQLVGRTLAARLRSVLRSDAQAAAAQIRLPALALPSSFDLVVPFWNQRRLRRLVPHLSAVQLRGGHLALYLQAEVAARAVLQFVAGLPGDDRVSP